MLSDCSFPVSVLATFRAGGGGVFSPFFRSCRPFFRVHACGFHPWVLAPAKQSQNLEGLHPYQGHLVLLMSWWAHFSEFVMPHHTPLPSRRVVALIRGIRAYFLRLPCLKGGCRSRASHPGTDKLAVMISSCTHFSTVVFQEIRSAEVAH